MKIHLRTYLYLILLYFFLEIIVYFTRQFFGINLIRLMLGIYLIINLLFVLLNLSLLQRVRKTVLFLFILVIGSTIYGLFNNGFSYRIISDFMKPTIFLCIYTIFSHTKIDFTITLKRMSFIIFKLMFYTSLFILITTLFISYRLGIILPFGMPLSYFLVFNDIFGIFIILIILFLSGNRASLLVALFSLSPKAIKYLKITLIFVVLSIVIIVIFHSTFNKNQTYRRIVQYGIIQGWEGLMSGDIKKLNTATAGRIGELFSSTNNMTGLDYIFGEGAGFTYEIDQSFNVGVSNRKAKDRGNVHFSPVSLFVSYGAIFMVVFYIFVLKRVYLGYKLRKHGFIPKISFILVTLILLESFFSFQLFINPLLPISIGLIDGYYVRTRNISNDSRFLKLNT